MPIVIKKKAATQPPEPLADPRPSTPVTPPPKPATSNERTPFHQLPVAETIDQLYEHPGKFRAPAPTECSLCGHPYGFPCHGKSTSCMNAKWARGEAA